MNEMTLPPTYYDFVRKLRPFVADVAEQDAYDLLARPQPLEAICSVDDYDSRFAQRIEQVDMGFLAHSAKQSGLSVELPK